MRGVVVTKAGTEKEKKENFGVSVKKYFYKPFIGGTLGYLGFFSLLMISKYLGYLIGNRASYQVDETDILLSLLGFAFIFIVKLRENTKDRII